MTAKVFIEARAGEQIAIGDNLVLTIEEKSGRVARLRFDAPEDLRIRKKETSATALRVMKERGVT